MEKLSLENSPLKELVVSWIRTAVVPPIAALLLQWLLALGITSLNSNLVFNGVTLILTGIWYLIFRGLEIISSKPWVKKWAGIFLGYPRYNG